MASEQPLPDRCGARVVDKVGLDVHADDVSLDPDESKDTDVEPSDLVADIETDHEYVFTDAVIDSVLLESDEETVTEGPEYIDVVKLLRHGHNLAAVDLTTPDGSVIRAIVEDEDPYVTNHEIDHKGYCERYPMDCGRCYVHKKAPKGNTRAMTHGLTAQRTNYYEAQDEEDKEFIEAMVDSWIESAPFGRDNVAKVNELYRIAVDQHRLWNATDEYVDEGMVTETVVDYDPEKGKITTDDGNPVNLPYSRLDRDLFKKLKELGCLSDPDSQQAEATMSLAQKLSGLADE